MATRYVGIGGNDGNDGSSWALRKLTLNGVEDIPVVAADIVYVGPGTYREMLILDVSGNAGNPITYIGDVTGEHTDGVGGVVRITGSDNDQATARDHCIDNVGDRDYRTFRGFRMDFTAHNVIDGGDSDHGIVEDCVILNYTNIQYALLVEGANQSDWIIRRCVFYSLLSLASVRFRHFADANANHLVENCLFVYSPGDNVQVSNIGDVTIRNCTFTGAGVNNINIAAAPQAGHPAIVENCVIMGAVTAGIQATGVGDVTEDFNTFAGNAADRINVNVGADSETYPALLQWPILHAGASQASGFKFPWGSGELSEWSQVRAITGSNEPGVDLHGVPRPVTASKNSWGPMQFVDMELESGTVQAGTYSRVLHDAGQVLARRIPVTGVEITITLYVRREANYAGNLPQMVIKQPGQADQVTVSVAAVNTWEQLSDTFTPSATPGFVEVWAESRNTAAAGNYEVFYDTMGVA